MITEMSRNKREVISLELEEKKIERKKQKKRYSGVE